MQAQMTENSKQASNAWYQSNVIRYTAISVDLASMNQNLDYVVVNCYFLNVYACCLYVEF